MVTSKPERKTIPGLREKATRLYENLGPVTKNEILAALIVVAIIVVLSAGSAISVDASGFAAVIKGLNKTAVLLCSTVLFYILKILDIEDLEAIPWNIILLFGGAMSIGFCLWETGAAEWLAINWLGFFKEANWFIFVMGIAFFVLIMTNFIMNVAAIAISLPVALVIAPYLGVAPEIILYASLVAAGMPFLLLVGAAPNAIAYDSKQFTSGQFFIYGVPASVLLMVVIGIAAYTIWPLMGMPVTLSAAQ
jgi:sodium-dependent dicarboxylate transporter 2/3/5